MLLVCGESDSSKQVLRYVMTPFIARSWQYKLRGTAEKCILIGFTDPCCIVFIADVWLGIISLQTRSFLALRNIHTSWIYKVWWHRSRTSSPSDDIVELLFVLMIKGITDTACIIQLEISVKQPGLLKCSLHTWKYIWDMSKSCYYMNILTGYTDMKTKANIKRLP